MGIFDDVNLANTSLQVSCSLGKRIGPTTLFSSNLGNSLEFSSVVTVVNKNSPRFVSAQPRFGMLPFRIQKKDVPLRAAPVVEASQGSARRWGRLAISQDLFFSAALLLFSATLLFLWDGFLVHRKSELCRTFS